MSRAMDLINRRARRDDTEHSVSLRVFTFMSVALGIATAGYYNELYETTALGLAGISAGYIFSYYRREYTNWWSRIVLAIGMFVSGYKYIGEMFYSTRDHVLVLTELLIILQVLHSFDLPRRKDLVYSVLSAFMLICVGGVLSRTLWYGVILMIFILISLTMLLIYHYQEASFGARVSGNVRQLVPMLRVLLALLVVGFPVFFILMPRYESHAFIGYPVSGRVRAMVQEYAGEILYPEPPSKAGGGGALVLDDQTGGSDFSVQYGGTYFGFFPLLDLNARGRLDDHLLMRVRTTGANYYRGLVFDKYTKRGWKMADTEGMRIANRSSKSLIQLDTYKNQQLTSAGVNSEIVFQTFYFESDMPNLIYAAFDPDDLYLPFSEIVMDRNTSLRAAAVLRSGSVYTVMSRVPRHDPRRLRMADKPCPDSLREYCTVENIPDSVVKHARRVTRGAATNYDRLMLLRDDLIRHTRYDLSAPRAPRGVDPVEYFLFTSRRGYCEHYASAFTLMARADGIPARLVTGFAAGQYNPLTGLFEISGRHAHAWSEVYFPFMGWVTFDPTPPGPNGPVSFEEVTPFSFFMNNFLKKYMGAARPVLARLASGANVWSAAVMLSLAALIYTIAHFLKRKRHQAIASKNLQPNNRRLLSIFSRALKLLKRRGIEITSASVPSEIARSLETEDGQNFLELARLADRAAYSGRPIMQKQIEDAVRLYEILSKSN